MGRAFWGPYIVIVHVDRKFLAHVCSSQLTTLSFLNVAARLGRLAPWWASESVWNAVCQYEPERARQWQADLQAAQIPGSCVILVANLARHQQSHLAAAWLMPLLWEPNKKHSPHLPPGLRDLAEQVVVQFSNRPQVRHTRWGLQLNSRLGLANIDLSGLTHTDAAWDSGWAALAGGLVQAAANVAPAPGILASVAWDERFGIRSVSAVKDKLDRAAWYASLVTTSAVVPLFLPLDNRADVEALLEKSSYPRLRLEFIAPVAQRPKADALLSEYFGAIVAPPETGADLENHVPYYCQLPRPKADAYYWEHLLPQVVKRCRDRLLKDHPQFSPSHVVTVVSNQRAVIAQGVLASGAKHCLLIYESNPEEGQIEKWLNEVKSFLTANGLSCMTAPVTFSSGMISSEQASPRDAELHGLRVHVQSFLHGVPNHQAAFDLTPGFKFISLILRDLAPPNSWLLYCRHRQVPPDHRVLPGSERYDCWQVSETAP